MASPSSSSSTPNSAVTFDHPLYILLLEEKDKDNGAAANATSAMKITRRPSAPLPTSHTQEETEYQTLLDSISTYVRSYLKVHFGLVTHWIPPPLNDNPSSSPDATTTTTTTIQTPNPAKCDILLSPNWDTASTLLIILQNHVGSQPGLWSRSTCISKGLHAGSMIPFVQHAHTRNYAVIIANPNTNSVTIDGSKHPIPGSSFPEEHSMYIYENYVVQSQATNILLFGYGNGAILCKEMLQRQLVRSSEKQTGEKNRIVGIATVEASVLIQEDDSADVKAFLGKYAVDWEASSMLPVGHVVSKTRGQLGVSQVLSVGNERGGNGEGEGEGEEEGVAVVAQQSTAWSIAAGMDSVFRFFEFCLQDSKINSTIISAPATPTTPTRGSSSKRGNLATGAGDNDTTPPRAAPPPSSPSTFPSTPATPTTPTSNNNKPTNMASSPLHLLRSGSSSRYSASATYTISPAENRGHRFAVEEAARLGVPLPATPKHSSLTRMMVRGFTGGGSGSGSGSGQGSTLNSSSSSSPSPSSSSPSSPRNHNKNNKNTSLFKRLAKMASGSLGSLSRSQGSNSSSSSTTSSSSPHHHNNHDLTLRTTHSLDGGCRTMALTERLDISDFDLLKVVGKGAFGKVMLVKKKSGPGAGAGKVYAMKVLNKDTIVKKGQIQHTMSERSILCEIRHPFIVRLRFAFQNDTSLYLVTDYYTGGSLFYHLRKNGSFAEGRARFYAAELLLALEHLHSQFIIYRDLKLENILMDSEGHIALTDFGLSKQNVRTLACATTFCGTAEYLAPELLRGKPYGAPVDWWSFGILLYEMMDGRTPFYNKNRKYMFHCIVHVRPTFPAHFSGAAQSLLTKLLEPDPARRLGNGSGIGSGGGEDNMGAKEIKEHSFFAGVDFDRLYRKKVTPPFNPRVKNEMDIKFVPSSYHKMAPKESEAQPTGAGTCPAVTADFKSFTYHGEVGGGHLGGGGDGGGGRR